MEHPRHPGDGGPRSVVRSHERSIPAPQRRRLGAHYTPEPLARRLAELALRARPGAPRLVCDPCCGAGSVLLAVADALVDRGLPADQVLDRRILGVEIDPAATVAARAALGQWGRSHGLGERADHLAEACVVSADSLTDPSLWGTPRATAIDTVVGNPPFLSPLAADTAGAAIAARRGAATAGLAGAYTDAASLHLLAAMDLVAPGGVVCLLQPQSVLGGRDSEPVRRTVAESADLVALWAAESAGFEAGVTVCAPVLVRRGGGPPGGSHESTVEVTWGDADPQQVSVPPAGAPWSPLLAAVLGVPVVTRAPGSTSGTLGDVATVTAGFRDEFYALAAVARDQPVSRGAASPRLVTAGMVDPGVLKWGTGSWRLDGRRLAAPRADMDRLRREHPTVHRWAGRRLVPKVVVASQTRVVEAAVDHLGDVLPVTPVVSVEPVAEGISPVMLAAVLAAPSTSATIARRAAGTGRSSRSLRVSASALSDLPLPASSDAWRRAAEAWDAAFPAPGSAGRAGTPTAAPPEGAEGWRRLGAVLDAAVGVEDDVVLDWWCGLVGRTGSVPR